MTRPPSVCHSVAISASHRLAVAIFLFLATIAVRPSAQVSAVTLERLFATYRGGDFDAVQQRLVRSSNDDLSSWERETPSFAGKHARDLAAAAFLLEAAQAGFLHGMPASTPFFETGCTIARTGPVGSVFDSAWQAAALALAEGESAGDDYGSAPPYAGAVRNSAFLKHIPHAEGRRIDPGTIALAKAVFQEQYARNAVLVLRSYYGAAPTALGPGGRDQGANMRSANLQLVLRAGGEAIDLFKKAEAYESVRPEAVLRGAAMRSYLSEYGTVLGAGWDDSIVTDLSRVEQLTSDPRLVFLSRLFRGRYLEARDRLPEAAKAFSDALRILPDASSARVGLASASFLGGQPVETSLVDAAASPSASSNDPWISYRYGDYRLWNDDLQSLRAAVKNLSRP